ncbi:MAG: hypothetical protein HY909_14395 [Deltaproteobacteria bacterium]|nr:hypothetical protein [Deltaproteobacteria bacterium]
MSQTSLQGVTNWRGAFIFWVLLGVYGCAGDPFRGLRDTAVAREAPVPPSGSPRVDGYFRAILHLQRWGVLGRRAREARLTGLTRVLEVRDDADLETLGRALQARLSAAGRTVRVAEGGDREAWDQALAAWRESLEADAAGDPSASPEARFLALQALLTVTLEPVEPGAPDPTLDQALALLAALLRESLLVDRLCTRMLAAPTVAASLRARGEALAPERPALEAEFRDARRFVDSVPARTGALAQESRRVVRWAYLTLGATRQAPAEP